MKALTIFLMGFLVLAGCDGTDDSATRSGPITCGAAEEPAGVQPDITSIENLFGCVTLTYLPDDGGEPVARSVVFSASSEREPILGGRTVGATQGFTAYLCAEVRFGDTDFLCVSGLLSSFNRYELSMDSQFKGSGTHQLCLGSLDSCSLGGSEFPIQAATIAIVRGEDLTKSISKKNETLSQIDMQQHNKAVKTIADIEKELVYQELIFALHNDQL